MAFWPKLTKKEVLEKLPIFLLATIAFFLPFERLGSFEVAGYTVRISQLLILALLVFFTWQLTGGAKKTKLHPAIKVFFLFWLVGLLSIINSPNLNRSIVVSVFVIFSFSTSLLVSNYLESIESLEKIIEGLFYGCLAVTLFGLYQFIGDLAGLPLWLTGLRSQYSKLILGFPRIQSTTLEPLYFANYLLIPLAFGAAALYRRPEKKQKKFLIGLLILIGINLILTASRAGIFAAIIELIVMAFILRPKNISARALGLGLAGFLAIILILQIVTVRSEDSFNSKINKFFAHLITLNAGAAFEERADTFLTAIKIWENHPLLGSGPGSFGPIVAYRPFVMPFGGWKIVNNETIELLTENGVLGLLLFLCFQIAIIWPAIAALRKGSPEARPFLAASLAAWIGIWIQYQTFSTLYLTHVWFTAGLLMALTRVASEAPTKIDKVKTDGKMTLN